MVAPVAMARGAPPMIPMPVMPLSTPQRAPTLLGVSAAFSSLSFLRGEGSSAMLRDTGVPR